MGSLANAIGVQSVPVVYQSTEEAHRVLGSAINQMQVGGMRNTGTKTLKANAVSTTVSDMRAGPNSVYQLMATNATGEAALASWSIRTRTSGSFVITHVSTSTADASIAFALFG